MENLVGRTWGSLSIDEKKFLMNNFDLCDANTGRFPCKNGDCIVNFSNGLAVHGTFMVGNDEGAFDIDADAVIYVSAA